MIGNLLIALGIILANGTNLYKKETKKQVEETPVNDKLEKRNANTQITTQIYRGQLQEEEIYIDLDNQNRTVGIYSTTTTNISTVTVKRIDFYIKISEETITHTNYYTYLELIRNDNVPTPTNDSTVNIADEFYWDCEQSFTYTYDTNVKSGISPNTELENNNDLVNSILNWRNTISNNDYSYNTTETIPDDYEGASVAWQHILNEYQHAYANFLNPKFSIIKYSGLIIDKPRSQLTNYQFTGIAQTIYNLVQDITTQEVIDLPGLLFQILGMPFAFISQAFNLTIFPNTPYAINISNLLFAVLAGLLIIIIVRKIIK